MVARAVGGHLAGLGGTIGRQVVSVAADAHVDDLGAVGPVIFQSADSLSYLLFHDGTVVPDRLRAIVVAAEPARRSRFRRSATTWARRSKRRLRALASPEP